MLDSVCFPAICRPVGPHLCENPKSRSGWVNERKTEIERVLRSRQYQGFKDLSYAVDSDVAGSKTSWIS